jgi:hypothetical protein
VADRLVRAIKTVRTDHQSLPALLVRLTFDPNI